MQVLPLPDPKDYSEEKWIAYMRCAFIMHLVVIDRDLRKYAPHTHARAL